MSRRRSAGSVATSLRGVASLWRTAALSQLRALAFWLAVGLPWAVLAFVLAGYADEHPVVLTVLVAGNVVCAVAGREYAGRRDSERTSR